ncbi:MAG TPA: IS1595 family transposase [Verrucomicrobiae bacterium]|nr:IS1595 family transposase [Verrucomicrobiae bacterium]
MKPKTLQDAILHFSNPQNCLDYMARKRWPDGVVTCPTCGRKDVTYLPSINKWQCKSAHKNRQFSAKVGTIFEDSHIPLEKWLVVVWMLCNCKNGVSSYEVAKAVGVTQKSAWFMLHRIRLGLHKPAFGTKIGGPDNTIEVDETWIGGKAKNMHKARRLRYEQSGGHHGKTVVMGMLDRDARTIRAKVVPNVTRDTLQTEILNNVKYGTKVYTDNAPAYDLLHWRYVHDFVDHAQQYVNGQVHTNGLENFWSLFKRNLRGTYVTVEPFHLFRYLDEQMFRYNNRGSKDNPVTDQDRFDRAMSQIFDKRITYSEVTGHDSESALGTQTVAW